jgi:tetratricopeptide (TPR) repeat protein
LSLYADSLWASGLFDQAEATYREALALSPELARGRHGLAKSLLARTKLDDAMNEAQAALRFRPRDLEIHTPSARMYERMHKYEEAAAAYANYVNLLPNKDKSDKAEWARAEIRFPPIVRPAASVRHGSRCRRAESTPSTSAWRRKRSSFARK